LEKVWTRILLVPGLSVRTWYSSKSGTTAAKFLEGLRLKVSVV
jgi:hypothetical protein